MSDISYSEKCSCECTCSFYHTKDETVCKFCAQDYHADQEHLFNIHYDLECIYCNMPAYMEVCFPKCHGISENQLENATKLDKDDVHMDLINDFVCILLEDLTYRVRVTVEEENRLFGEIQLVLENFFVNADYKNWN